MRRMILCASAAALLAACGDAPETDSTETSEVPEAGAPVDSDSPSLQAILAAQPEEAQARYKYRNPEQVLEFFEVQPGMTVVEALPGGGWYSKILLPYVGSDGAVIGVDYSMEMWAKFPFATPEWLEERKGWTETWTADATGWAGTTGGRASAYRFGAMPPELNGTADAVLFVRAMHNLARFESDGGFLSTAIADAYRALKPGGIVGIVQHRAPADKPDDWANGSRGYLKQEFVVATMEAAGFEFVEASEINANPKDQPGEDDIVWRLPPTYATSREEGQEELKAAMTEIGESDRMTLKFRKPAG